MDGPKPPARLITPTDKRGLLDVVTAVLLSFVLVSSLTRCYIRFRVSRLWRWDDSCVMAATAACIAYCTLLFFAMRSQFGLTIQDVDQKFLSRMQQLLFASDILYITVVGLTKCAAALLFLSLNPTKLQELIAWVLFGLATTWVASGIPTATAGCNPSSWLQSCKGEMIRWQIISAFDIAMEILLFANAILLVFPLQLRPKIRLTVLFAFGMRLPIIAACGVRLFYIRQSLQSSDPTLSSANRVVWTTVELSYAVISCTLLCLGPFLTPFEKSYVDRSTRRPSYKMSTSRSINLEQLSGSTRNDSKSGTLMEPKRGRTWNSVDADSQRAVLGATPRQVEWRTTVDTTSEADAERDRQTKKIQQLWNDGW